MGNPTTTGKKRNKNRAAKPEKPYEGFPLFPHDSGQWAKKIRGKLHYFGVWTTPDEALKRFNREWPYLKEGRTPPPENISDTGCTLRELANDFLDSKQEKLNAGELSPLSFNDYFRTCEGLIDHFGKDRRVDDLRPDDFRAFRAKLAKRFGVVRLRNEINRVCIVFKYAFDNELIEKPVRFGQEFSRPSAKQLRRDRNKAGEKLFTREESQALIDGADVHLRAMIYLGLNCGFGNTDVANLPLSAVDLETGWVFFPRPKTEIQRRVPLWPETVQALRESLANRPQPSEKEFSGLFFLTRFGVPWVRWREKPPKEQNGNAADPTAEEKDDNPGSLISSVCLQFGKLRKSLDVGRRGLGFYTFRHCFETIGGESKDQVAVDAIMGHVDSTMAGNYRQRISDERLRAVVDVVRDWLIPPEEETTQEGGAGPEGGAE